MKLFKLSENERGNDNKANKAGFTAKLSIANMIPRLMHVDKIN